MRSVRTSRPRCRRRPVRVDFGQYRGNHRAPRAQTQRLDRIGFIRPAHAGIMIVDAGLEPLLDKMAAYQPHAPIFAMKAEDL